MLIGSKVLRNFLKKNFAVKKHEMSPFKTANEIVKMTLKLMPKKKTKNYPTRGNNYRK